MSKNKMKTSIALEQTGLFDIYDTDLKLGWFGLQFYVITAKGEKLQPEEGHIVRESKDEIVWIGNLAEHLQIELRLRTSATGKSKTVTPIIRNLNNSEFIFKAYGFQLSEAAKGLKLPDSIHNTPVYANAENLRLERLPYSRFEFPFIRQIPVSPVHVGTQSSGPIPVTFFSNPNSDIWLMEGSLTQKRHLQNWHFGMSKDNPGKIDYRCEFTWTGGSPEIVQANSSSELETILYQVIRSKPDTLYESYISELTEIYEFQGVKSRLNNEPVFCSWNFDVFTNINEADCFKRIEKLGKLQGKGFFQLDHGYQPQLSGEPAPLSEKTPATPDVDAYYPDSENAWDRTRFPSGPQGIINACKKHGLRPSLWWSPRVAEDGRIAKEHPEWILVDSEGTPLKSGHYFLDSSVPEVWDFLEKCIKKITQDWGFKGMKLDFYSWMFDHPDAQFRYGGTGIELKTRFFKMIRQYLGEKSYFLHCISCPLGNPFLAIEGYDAFRAGMDIDIGDWEHHIRSVSWLLPSILASGTRTWYANIDSCMGKPEIPSLERRARLAFAYISGGMLEFSGKVESFDEEMENDYRLLCSRCDQGGSVRCPDSKAFYGMPLPEILIRDHTAESWTYQNLKIIKTIALFNWTDQQKTISFKLEDQYKATDFWSGQCHTLEDGTITAKLEPRGHLILDLRQRENTPKQ